MDSALTPILIHQQASVAQVDHIIHAVKVHVVAIAEQLAN